jgi:serine/threonine protein kinase
VYKVSLNRQESSERMPCVNERCQQENEPGTRVCVRCGCLLPGVLLVKRYRIEGLLGVGGMGAVYRASDLQLEREVALKALLPRERDADELRQRFLREAKMAVRLEHTHILPVYHTDEDDGIAFLLMPLLRGGTLKERMKGRPLPPGEALTYLRQLGSALDYAHTRPEPIIHRDVKPANILFHHEGDRLMLSDFGIARLGGAAPDLTRPDVAPGTVQFMAPEQGKGHAVPASDQYSAAVILYGLLTGRLPFEGPDGLALAIQHATEMPLPPSQVHPGLSAAVDAVVLRALAKQPEDRFPTLRAFVRALDMALRSPRGGVSTLTRPRGETFPSLPAVRLTLPTVRPTPAPVDIAALRRQAKEARNAQKYQEAVHLYRQVVSLDPAHAPTWFWLGWSLNALGNFGEAISAFDACLELEHNRARVWNTRGYALYMLGRYDEALACCERVLTLEPDNAAAWQNRGVVLQKLGQPEEMLRSLERAARFQPTPLRFQRIAEVLRSLGRELEALQWEARLHELPAERPIRPHQF